MKSGTRAVRLRAAMTPLAGREPRVAGVVALRSTVTAPPPAPWTAPVAANLNAFYGHELPNAFARRAPAARLARQNALGPGLPPPPYAYHLTLPHGCFCCARRPLSRRALLAAGGGATTATPMWLMVPWLIITSQPPNN